MREYAGPTRQPLRITFVPGDPPRLAAVAHQDAQSGAVYLWRPDWPEPTVLPWTHGANWAEPVLAASPDGRWLVAGPLELVWSWDVAVDPPAREKALAVHGLLTARYSGRSDRLSIVCREDRGRDFRVIVRDCIVEGPQVGRPGGRLHDLPMSRDLAARLARMSPSDWRLQSALSDDGSRLAVAPRELPTNPLAREAFVWDIGAGKPPRRIEASGHPCGLSFSPDGSRLVVDVGTVYVYDTASLEEVARWKAKYSYAPGLAWSPDGRLLARTDEGTTVRVYEAATGRQVMAVGSKRGRLGCVAFSPDGLTLATATSQGPVRVWDVG